MIVERSAALTGRRIACETVRRRISSTSNGAITTDSGRGGWRRSPVWSGAATTRPDAVLVGGAPPRPAAAAAASASRTCSSVTAAKPMTVPIASDGSTGHVARLLDRLGHRREAHHRLGKSRRRVGAHQVARAAGARRARAGGGARDGHLLRRAAARRCQHGHHCRRRRSGRRCRPDGGGRTTWLTTSLTVRASSSTGPRVGRRRLAHQRRARRIAFRGRAILEEAELRQARRELVDPGRGQIQAVGRDRPRRDLGGGPAVQLARQLVLEIVEPEPEAAIRDRARRCSERRRLPRRSLSRSGRNRGLESAIDGRSLQAVFALGQHMNAWNAA